MWQVTLAGLRAHAVRFVLTGLVVVLSVGFTAGTLVLSDSLDRAGVAEITATARGVDLSVSPAASPTGDDHGGRTDHGPSIGDAVEAIRSADGVATAIPRAETSVRGSDIDGRIDEGVWVRVMAVPADGPATGVTLTDGRLPRRGDEAVLDATTAERAEVGVGDSYTIAPWDADPMTFTVVGISRPAVTGGAALATTIDTVTAMGAEVTRVDVVLDDAGDPTQVAAAVAELTGGEVETGAELTDRLVSESPSLANALRVPLLILGAVAVIVAAFVIANTFRILVAQRTRDLALLRTVGATRRQVRRGVVTESFAVGGAGSGLGLILGVAAAALAATLITAADDLTVVVSPMTVAWSLLIGIGVTVGAAWVPARAATRVAPLAALRTAPDESDDGRTGRVRYALGIVLVLGGTGILAVVAAYAAELGNLGLVVVLLGATGCGLGVLVLGPVIMPPMVGLSGRLTRTVAGARRRATLDLATANALRHPRRVAATSGALLIGVTVVVGFAVMATSARDGAQVWVDDTVPADITVSVAGSGQERSSIPESVVAAVEDVPDIRVALSVHSTHAEVDGSSDGTVDVNGIDLNRFDTLTDTDQVLPGRGEALLDEQTAAYGDIKVGDVMTIMDAHGERHDVTIVDVTQRAGVGLALPLEWFHDLFPGSGIASIAVDAVDGVDVETIRTGIVERTASHPDIVVRNAADVRDDAMAQFDRAIGVALAVLGLAVVIAVIGIGNTMSLAVHERTREIGLLRALGLTRRQTWSMLGAEAVMISVVAGVLGVVMALVFSWVAVQTLPDIRLTVPWVALAATVVVAGFLGLMASLIPARRAARTSPVAALASGE